MSRSPRETKSEVSGKIPQVVFESTYVSLTRDSRREHGEDNFAPGSIAQAKGKLLRNGFPFYFLV